MSEIPIKLVRRPDLPVVPDAGTLYFIGDDEGALSLYLGNTAGIAQLVGSFADGGIVHVQTQAAAIWTVNHNLGYKPSVELRTTGGVRFVAGIYHISDNHLEVRNNWAIAGTARMT